jgi:hypothetical protein
MTAGFWAGCRIGLRRNTRADRLKLSFLFDCGPPNQRPFFFWNAKANSKAWFQQLIFYGLPDHN